MIVHLRCGRDCNGHGDDGHDSGCRTPGQLLADQGEVAALRCAAQVSWDKAVGRYAARLGKDCRIIWLVSYNQELILPSELLHNASGSVHFIVLLLDRSDTRFVQTAR